MGTEASGPGNYGFDCLLIDLVRKNDLLWRKSNPYHFDEAFKKKTWQGIAESLDESVEFCTTRWLTLRAQYVRKLKKYGPGGGDEHSWPYMEEMSFLNAVIKQRNRSKNSNVMQYMMTPTHEQDSEPSVSTFQAQSPWGNTFTPGFCVAEVNSTDDVHDSTPKRMRTAETNSESTSTDVNQDNDIMKGVVSLIKLTQQSQDKKTANELFCESIALQLQDILDKNPRQSNVIKMKIMSVVTDLSDQYVFNNTN